MEYVAGFYFRDGEVLLIEKQRPNWQKGKLNGIGGHIEKGETAIEAMVREFKEETGCSITAERWSMFCKLSNMNNDFTVYFFRADALDTDIAAKSMTDEKVVWVECSKLINTIPNLQWLIPMASVKQRNDWVFNVMERM